MGIKRQVRKTLERLLDLRSITIKSSEIFLKRSEKLLLSKLSNFQLFIARSTLKSRPMPTTPVTTQPAFIQSSPPPCRPRVCQVSFWSRWSPCSHQCGTSGTQTRARTVTAAATCGRPCPHLSEMRLCNTDNCQNSGTPTSNGCSCPPGYNGTCCEIGNYSCRQNTLEIHMAS